MPAVDDAFDLFLHRIELNPARVELASRRYQAVKAVIEADLDGATVRQIGSFQRKTKIRPNDLSDRLDVDALAVLGTFNSHGTAGSGVAPAKAFERVLRTLRRDTTYRLMDPARDAPVVVLEYADGFAMEVAVGYLDETGDYPRTSLGGPLCYVVADHGNWKPADYDFDAEYISSLNQLAYVAGALVPTIKMLKFLMRVCQVPLYSIHTEILAAFIVPNAIEQWHNEGKEWGYRHVIAKFLRSAEERLTGPVAIPGSHSPPVDSGLPAEELARIAKFLGKMGDTASRLCEIEDPHKAVKKWGDFFGEPFPAPSAVLQ